MRILYIANIRLPTEKAHGIQIMKTCEALAQNGDTVTLLVPRRFNVFKESPIEYYKIHHKFQIKKIFCVDTVPLGYIGFLIESFTFSVSVILYTLFKNFDAYYSRDQAVLFPLSFFKRNLFWESHMGFSSRMLLKRLSGIVCITDGLKDLYIRKGFSSEAVLVAHDAVDIEMFNISKTASLLREKLNLPQDKTIVMYTGSVGLYDWKGVDVFLETAMLVESNVSLVLVGGSKEEIEVLRRKYPSGKIVFAGRQPHSNIPHYLKAADILVLPNKSGDLISEKYTSPMKLFEYMASKRVIVASDLPSIREILDNSNAFLIPPDDSRQILKAIECIQSSREEANRKADKAFTDVEQFSWQKRAEHISSFVKRVYEKKY